MSGVIDPLIGRTINNKYEIVEFIGRGGMGVVYKARHKSLNRDLAIKILRFDQRKDPVVLERFRREALAASSLKHPGIVDISDFDQLFDKRMYIVMEFIPGQSIREIIKLNGKLELKRAMAFLMQIADALGYAHEQGIIHRDLKSENIFVTFQRNKEITKILDFGLAKIISSTVDLQSITSEGQIYGTPETMAPEQIASSGIDHRVDLYALGVLTYEILTGTPPYTGSMLQILMAHKKSPIPKLSDKYPEAPSILDDLIFKSMAKSPDLRFAKAEDMYKIYKEVFENIESPNTFSIISNKIHKSNKHSHFSSDEFLNNKKLILHKFRNHLMELSEYISDIKIGSSEIPFYTNKLNEISSKLFKLKLEINNLKSEMEEKEENYRITTAKLRYALINIGLEIKNLNAQSNSAVKDDLIYQHKELEKRLAVITAKSEEENEKEENKMLILRRNIDELIYEQNKYFDLLWDLILEVKDKSKTSATLKSYFEKLFELQTRLDKKQR